MVLALYYILDHSGRPYPTRSRPLIADLMHLASINLGVGPQQPNVVVCVQQPGAGEQQQQEVVRLPQPGVVSLHPLWRARICAVDVGLLKRRVR